MTDNASWDRWAPASGLAFVALSLTSWLLFIGAPGVDGSAADAVSYVQGHRGRLLTAGALTGLALVPFICFLGSLTRRLQAAGDRDLNTIAFGSGLLSASLLALIAALPAALAFNIVETAQPSVVKAIYDFVWPLQLLIAFPTALLVAATSFASLRTHLLPRPVSWAGIGCSFVVVIGGTTWAKTGFWSPSHGYGYVSLFTFLSWMVVVCLLLMRDSDAGARSPNEETSTRRFRTQPLNDLARGQRAALWLDLAVKAALLGLLMLALLRPDLPQFEGERMQWRALAYPLVLLVVPLCYRFVPRWRPRPYPYALDILLPLPLLVDTAGPGLYDRVAWWDEFMHVLSWFILAAAFLLVLGPLRLDRALAAGLAVGFGACIAIAWEVAEYFSFIRDSPNMDTAYTDTLGDLAAGLAGSAVAAVIVTAMLRPWRKVRDERRGQASNSTDDDRLAPQAVDIDVPAF